MKNLKKLTALVLAVCLLIGLPLSVDVAATGAADGDFRLLQAMMIPEHWENTGLDRDTQVALYFSGRSIYANTTHIKAFIGIVGQNNWNYDSSIRHYAASWLGGQDTYDRLSFSGTLSKANTDPALAGTADANGGFNPNYWVFTMDPTSLNNVSKTANINPAYQHLVEGDKVDTIPELQALAKAAGKRLAVVIVDGASTGSTLNNMIGRTTSAQNPYPALVGDTTKANPNHGNNNGSNSGAHAIVYDETTAPRLTGVDYDSRQKTLTVRFSEALYGRGAVGSIGISVINQANTLMGFSSAENAFAPHPTSGYGVLFNNSADYSFPIQDGMTQSVISLTDAAASRIDSWQARVDAHNEAHPDDPLRLVYFIEESSNTYEWRGEGRRNYYMDSLWTADGRPFMANVNTIKPGTTGDAMVAEIRLVTVNAETVDEAVASVPTKLLIRLPKTMALTGNEHLAVYKGDTLVQIDGADAVWPLNCHSNQGQSNRYIATVTEAFGCDKLSEIEAMLAEKGIAFDSIALAYQSERVPLTPTDKTTLRVLDTSLFAGQSNSCTVVMTFSEEVDLDAFKNAGEASKVYLTMKEAGRYTFYSGYADGYAQVRLPKDAMSYYGNSKNKIQWVISNGAAVDALEQLVADTNGAAELSVRIESSNVTGGTAVPLGLNPLNTANLGVMAQQLWNTGARVWLPVTVEEEVRIETVKQTAKNQLVVTFNLAVNIDTDQPWIGLRMVNDKDQLVWLHRGADGAPFDSTATSQGLDMQWRASGWRFVDDDPESADYHKQILVTFAQSMDMAKLLDMDNFPLVKDNPDKYEIKFAIEETTVAAERGNSRVADVTAVANPNNQLRATKPVTGASMTDGAYVTVTNLLTDTTQISVSDAAITGENQVTVTFSHAVNIQTGNNQSQSVSAYFRYVNENNILYGNATDGYVMVSAQLTYADDTHTKLHANITRSASHSLSDLDDLINPTGQLKAFMEANPGRWVLVLEEKSNTVKGQIDTFAGVDGHVIEATKLIPNWADGLYLELTGELIKGELSATKCEVVGDHQLLVTFSAPIQIAKKPDGTEAPVYASMRLYSAQNKLLFHNPVTQEYTTTEQMFDKDGNRIYKGPDGYTTEKSGDNGKGEIVNYTALSNDPMQWSTTWTWANEEHTQILYNVSSVKNLPVNALPDMLTYDWDAIAEGAYIGFDFEEKYDGVKINNDWHVQNIVRADDPRIALDATFFPHSLDSVMWTLKEDMVWTYTPQKITATAEVVDDMSIRVRFSTPVDMEFAPYFGLRLIDKNGKLMWSGEENVSTPYTWAGTWKWEDETHQSLIWTINANGMLGGNSLYSMANWVGVLQKFKDEGTWMFCIEEKTRDGFSYLSYNNRIDNISAKGTKNLMMGTYGAGTSGALLELDMSKLLNNEVALLSAQAVNDRTITLTFSEPVAIGEAVSMGVRYLTPLGDSEVLTDGRTAYFKGDWAYADDTKKVITWTLNSKYATSLTDILQFNGNLKWNEGARVAFVIMDEGEDRLPLNTMRIRGVQDLNGVNHLLGNYKTDEFVMTQLDIEVLYELPVIEPEPQERPITYVTDYKPVLIVLCATTAISLVAAIVIVSKRKKNG